jgi:glycosyltransferase involved in cell wall biosynthesis
VDIVFDQFNAGSAGLLVLEAMSMAIPVFIHFGQEYEAFFDSAPPVVNVYSEDEICSRMHELVANVEKRKALGAAARQWVVKHYGWEAVIEKFIKFYEEILGGRKL